MRHICHSVSHVRVKQLRSVVFLFRTGHGVLVAHHVGLFKHGIGQESSPAMALECVLNIHGSDRRYVFQGVHRMFEGRIHRPWGAGPRVSQLCFVGRDLNREVLTAGLEECLA